MRPFEFSWTLQCDRELLNQPDVNCLIRQGWPEGMVLTTIKRTIKGQAQELVLHMGESASLSDILQCFEMMFGDVNPPHVLLAQFYAAEQGANESITEWYARLKDIVSKITRKDASIICLDNNGIVVNTQFWTKLHSCKITDALRHKFNPLAGSPNFIVEARKVDVEFSAQAIKVQQADAEMSPMFQKGSDEILARLTALETKFSQVTPSSTSAASTPSQPTQHTQGIHDHRGQEQVPRRLCDVSSATNWDILQKNYSLNFKGSEKGSGPTSQ